MSFSNYKKLLSKYLHHEISVEEFSSKFEDIFLSEDSGMDDELFEILEDLFEDNLAFDPNVSIEDEKVSRISENTFRNEVIDALNKLSNLQRGT